MAAKSSKRPDLEVHLGSSGRILGRLHLGSGKRSAFSYDQRWLQEIRRAHARLRQKDRETPALEPIDFLMWVDDEARVGALRLYDPDARAYVRSGGEHWHVPPLGF